MPDEIFDNETGSEESEDTTGSVESEVEAEDAGEEVVAKDNEPPKWVQQELKAARERAQRAEQDAQQLRMQFAQFQFQNQKQQEAVLNPEMDELRKILKPILDAELAPERERRMALEKSLAIQEQVIQADTNIRIIQNELGSDWEEARRLMVPYLESKTERSRNSLLENPDLFIEKARELLEKSRNGNNKVAMAVLKTKMKHESGDSPRVNKSGFDPATASDEEFRKYLQRRNIL